MKNENDTKLELRRDILNTYQHQFSENQNHNQKLFIQFFSAVLIIVAAYAFVYAYTGTESDDFFIRETSAHSNQFYYSITHLVGSYVIVQVILIFLGALILHIGYSFRREQKMTVLVRDIAFEEDPDHPHSDAVKKFVEAQKAFTPQHKGLLKNSFLPTFNAMFFNFIVMVQTLLLISIVISLMQTESAIFILFKEHFFVSLLIFSIPIFISLLEYVRYYIKYKVRIDEDITFRGRRYNEIFSIVQEVFQLVPIFLTIDYYTQPSAWSVIFRILGIVTLSGCILVGIIGIIYISFRANAVPKAMVADDK